MSIDRCSECNRQVDTDLDTDCYVEVGNMRRMTWTIVLCEHCRNERENDQERAELEMNKAEAEAEKRP